MTKFRKIINIIGCIFIFIFSFIAILVLYAVFIEPNILIIKNYNLYIPNWNTEHNGIKAAVISDFHAGGLATDEKQLRRIVKKTNEQNADFIFLLGDIDSIRIRKAGINPKEVSEIFSQFSAKYGVYAILGNHDYNKPSIKKILKDANINLLEDSVSIQSINSKPLKIYGLRDFWYYDYNKNLIDKNDKSGSIIVLSHNPDTFPFIPGNTSVTLSGHTHGGQIYLPFLGGIFCSSMYAQRFIKGYVVENNKHIFITSGVGNSAPARFGNIPEIVILHLYSQKDFPDKKILNTKKRTGITNIYLLPMYFDFMRKVFKKDVQY